MTPDYIAEKLNEIISHREDAEMAHAIEDKLYQDFIYHVSASSEVPDEIRAMAALVLGSKLINFPRHCG